MMPLAQWADIHRDGYIFYSIPHEPKYFTKVLEKCPPGELRERLISRANSSWLGVLSLRPGFPSVEGWSEYDIAVEKGKLGGWFNDKSQIIRVKSVFVFDLESLRGYYTWFYMV